MNALAVKTCMDTPFRQDVTFMDNDRKALQGSLHCVKDEDFHNLYILTARVGEEVLGIAYFNESSYLIEIKSIENNTRNDATRSRMGIPSKVHKIGTHFIDAIAFAAKQRKKDIWLLAIDSHPFYLKSGFKVMTDPNIKRINHVIRKIISGEEVDESDLIYLGFGKKILANRLGIASSNVTPDLIKRYGELCEGDEKATRILAEKIERENIRATLLCEEADFFRYIGSQYMLLECESPLY